MSDTVAVSVVRASDVALLLDALVMLLAIALTEAVVGIPGEFVVPMVSTVGVSLVVDDGDVDVKIME
jgi:hypothetical protein